MYSVQPCFVAKKHVELFSVSLCSLVCSVSLEAVPILRLTVLAIFSTKFSFCTSRFYLGKLRNVSPAKYAK